MIRISIDQKLNEKEANEIRFWLQATKGFQKNGIYREIDLILERALKLGKFDEEDRKDLLYICERYQTPNPLFTSLQRDIQVLHGILHGVLADNQITIEEAQALKQWLFQNEQLSTVYPYDELVSLLTSILKDGKIDPEELAILQIFLAEFVDFSKSLHVQESEIESLKKSFTIPGVCALAPEIIPEERVFSFTGISARGDLSHIISAISTHDGIYSSSLRKDTSYLIIGGNAQNCWGFSCFGRKVEEAIEMRKSGSHLLIVHEIDFWDAMG